MNRSLAILRRGAPRLITVLGVLAICLGSSSKSCRLIQDNIENREDLSFAVALTVQDAGGQITDVFQRDELIQFVMTVRNELGTRATVQFPTTRTADFVVVRDQTADVVWQWSDDQAAPQPTPTELVFESGETKTFIGEWRQTNSAGAPVRSGAYQVRGALVFSGFDADPLQDNDQASPLVRFTISD